MKVIGLDFIYIINNLRYLRLFMLYSNHNLFKDCKKVRYNYFSYENFFFNFLIMNHSLLLNKGALAQSKKEVLMLSSNFIFNSLSLEFFSHRYKLYNILKSMLFIKRWPKFWFFRIRFVGFYDFFMFCVNIYLNTYFPWYESSLIVNYCSLQFQCIVNRRLQTIFFNIYIGFNKAILKYTFDERFVKLKIFSIRKSSVYVKGRVGGLKFCNKVRYSFFWYKPNNVFVFNTKYSISSFDKAVFITRWGSSSIEVLLSYTNLF